MANLSQITDPVYIAEKGQPLGVATLDAGGKVPITQLPNSIMEYKGNWNAATNTPTLADGVGNAGDVYRVTADGTQFAPPISFNVGDYAIYNGTKWEKSDATDAVISVNGFTGPVSLTTTNIPEGTNLYYTNARVQAFGDPRYILNQTSQQASSNFNISGTGVFGVSCTFTPVAAPSYQEGKVFYDSTVKALSVMDDISGTSIQVGYEGLVRCRNNTGSTITNGQVVYISGSLDQNPTIALAQANSLATAGVIGIATHDIPNNTVGKVTVFGLLNDLNTSGFTEGDFIYLSATTPGAFTNVAPTSPNIVVSLGAVQTAHPTQGKILGITSRGLATNTALGTSNAIAPTQGAVKVYVDAGLALKEDLTNKATSLVSPDNIKYPTTLAVSNAIAAIPTPTLQQVTTAGNDTNLTVISTNTEGFKVRNDTGSLAFYSAGNTLQGFLKISLTEMQLYSQSGVPILFGTSGTEKMRLTNSGALGIGTNSPSTFLDVRGTGITSTGYTAPSGTDTSIYAQAGKGITFDTAGGTSKIATSGRFLINTTIDDGTSALQVNGVIKNNDYILTDAGATKGRITLDPTGTSFNAIYSSTTGFGAYKLFGIGSGGLLISNRTGAFPTDDGSSAIMVNGHTHTSSLSAGAYVTNTIPLTVRASQAVGNSTLYVNNTNNSAGIYGLYIEIPNTSNTSKGIAVANNGIEQFVFTGAGNMGLGTNNPGARLHVASGGIYVSNSINNDLVSLDHPGVMTWRTRLTTDNTSSYVIGNDNGGLFGTQVLTLAQSGNVGIGTTTPGSKLSVYDAVDGNAEIALQSAGNSIYKIQQTGNLLKIGASGDPINIVNTGNVGIGTTAPETKVDVRGDIVSSGGPTITQGRTVIGFSTGSGYVAGESYNGANWIQGDLTLSAINTNVSSNLVVGGTLTVDFIQSTTSNQIQFNAGSGDMYFTNDLGGTLSIGNPVNNLRASALEVTGNTWCTDAYILGPVASSTPTAEFGLAGSGAFVRTMNSSAELTLQTNTAIRIYLSPNSEFVGFNNIAPSSTVDINGTNGYSQLRMRTQYTPSSSADGNGQQGDLAYDANFIYIKTTGGWKRTALSTF